MRRHFVDSPTFSSRRSFVFDEAVISRKEFQRKKTRETPRNTVKRQTKETDDGLKMMVKDLITRLMIMVGSRV